MTARKHQHMRLADLLEAREGAVRLLQQAEQIYGALAVERCKTRLAEYDAEIAARKPQPELPL